MAAVLIAALAASSVGCSEPSSPGAGGTSGITAPEGPASPAAGDIQEAEGPMLTVSSPASGATVTAPVSIRYQVHGIEVGEGMHLHAFIDSTSATPIEIAIQGSTGAAVLPSHPLLGGRRDLILELARADHRRVQGARVVLHDLIIEGERSG